MAKDTHAPILSGRYHAHELAEQLISAYWLLSSGNDSTGLYLLRQAEESYAILSKQMEGVKALLASQSSQTEEAAA